VRFPSRVAVVGRRSGSGPVRGGRPCEGCCVRARLRPRHGESGTEREREREEGCGIGR
jgi:hypothetical protein